MNPANGHTYIATYKNGFGGMAGDDSARAAAAELGGYPATATDAAENDWIWQNFWKGNAGASGTASTTAQVPAGTTGITVFSQA